MSPANVLLSLHLFLLTTAFHNTYASPIDQPSLTQAPPLNTTRLPKTPVCPFTLGHPTRMIFFKQYCELAIAKIPRDIRPSSPTRNFYLLPQDRSRSMNNQLLPLEWEEGDCVIQLLMAASFRDIPHDTATWMDIWGPARLILQQCITPRRGGGIITHIGDYQKMDLVIFSKASTYAATRRLLAGRVEEAEAAAVDLADFEYLQLLGLVGRGAGGEVGGVGNATETTVGEGEGEGVGPSTVPAAAGGGQSTNAEGVVTA